MRTKFRSPDRVARLELARAHARVGAREPRMAEFDGETIGRAPPGASYAIGIWMNEQSELYAPITPITPSLST